MGPKRNNDNGTSPVVSVPAIIVWLAACVLALHMHAAIAAALFFCLAVLGILLRLWANRAIQHVSLHLHCSRPWLFPGQTTTLCYTLENRKSLPLFWLEVIQNGPQQECLVPDDNLESYHEAGTKQDTEPYLRQNFAFVSGWQSLKQDTTWTAQHRGLYPIIRMSARTGDGFGLVQRSCHLQETARPTLAVFPQPVPTNLAPLLSLQWDAQAAQRGWMQDQTILQGNRQYQPSDNWKHINWRMAAREQGLPVNLYQTIQPQTMHFALDGESFSRFPYELEDMLSILTGMLIELDSRNMQITLSLSQSAVFPAQTLTAGSEHGVSELLYYLAGFSCLMVPVNEADPVPPSVFPDSLFSAAEPVWMITRSGKSLPLDFLQHTAPDSVRFLCMEDAHIPAQAGYHAFDLHTIRKEVHTT